MGTHEAQKMVYVIGMAAGGLIEAMGMHAKNQERLRNDESIAFDHEAFNQIMLDRGLHHNALISQIYHD